MVEQHYHILQYERHFSITSPYSSSAVSISCGYPFVCSANLVDKQYPFVLAGIRSKKLHEQSNHENSLATKKLARHLESRSFSCQLSAWF